MLRSPNSRIREKKICGPEKYIPIYPIHPMSTDTETNKLRATQTVFPKWNFYKLLFRAALEISLVKFYGHYIKRGIYTHSVLVMLCRFKITQNTLLTVIVK